MGNGSIGPGAEGALIWGRFDLAGPVRSGPVGRRSGRGWRGRGGVEPWRVEHGAFRFEARRDQRSATWHRRRPRREASVARRLPVYRVAAGAYGVLLLCVTCSISDVNIVPGGLPVFVTSCQFPCHVDVGTIMCSAMLLLKKKKEKKNGPTTRQLSTRRP